MRKSRVDKPLFQQHGPLLDPQVTLHSHRSAWSPARGQLAFLLPGKGPKFRFPSLLLTALIARLSHTAAPQAAFREAGNGISARTILPVY